MFVAAAIWHPNASGSVDRKGKEEEEEAKRK